MTKHVYSLLCRRVLIDDATKVPSYIDLIDGLEYQPADIKGAQGQDKPAVIALDLSLVSLWTRDDPGKPDHARVRVTLESPDSNAPHARQIEYDVDLRSARNHRQTLNLQGIQFRGDGDYVFRVEIQRGDAWELCASPFMTVKPHSPPDGNARREDKPN